MIKHIKYFFYFFLLWSLLLIAFNYYNDPIQFYRKAEKPYFTKNQRYQIPGLIKHYSFNTIMVGTSLSEKFLSSHLDSYMGTKSINFAISGSSAKEQAQVVRMALASDKVTNVLWELNYKSFLGVQPNLIKGGDFPIHFYDNDIFAHFYYLYSIDTVWMSIKRIIRYGGKKDLETLSYWGVEKTKQFDSIRVIKHYCSLINKTTNDIDLSAYTENIKDNLEKLILENKKTHFYLFLPPLSILNFYIHKNKTVFNNFRQQIYKLRKYPNITLYDFMTYYDIITNNQNYKDVMHYSPSISEIILKDIANNNNKNKPTNYDSVKKDFDILYNKQKDSLPDCNFYSEKGK